MHNRKIYVIIVNIPQAGLSIEYNAQACNVHIAQGRSQGLHCKN